MKRLKANEVAAFRNAKLKQQGGICPLCGQSLGFKEAVLDHDHKTGICRGVIHRGCNSLLGKIENARLIAKLSDDQAFQTFLSNVVEYQGKSLGVLHNTHKTDEEKRLLRNKRARLRRKRKQNG